MEVSLAPGERRPLPQRLSPSRASDFKRCPKLFEYKTILGYPTPSTIATARGTLFHLVFEHLFDLERTERTKQNAHRMVRPAWELLVHPDKAMDEVSDPVERWLRDVSGLWIEQLEGTPDRLASTLERAHDYVTLAPQASRSEASIIKQVEDLVDNYFFEGIERVQNFDPEGREVHLQAQVGELKLHGFIDRLDRYVTSEGEERWVISDYKTGKPPQSHYRDDAFFGLRVYALLLEVERHTRPHKLRLIYPSGDSTTGVVDEMVDEARQERTRSEMLQLWSEIRACDEGNHWPTRPSRLCDWCHFKADCPAFRS